MHLGSVLSLLRLSPRPDGADAVERQASNVRRPRRYGCRTTCPTPKEMEP